MSVKIAATIVAAVVALGAIAPAATAATPAAASSSIARCLRHAGATHVAIYPHGGRATFGTTGTHYVEWHPLYVDGRGQLQATATVSAGISQHRAAVNHCLRPYNGSV